MDSLRTVLVIIGLLIILGLLGHGLWTIRKNNQVAKDKRESLERKRRRPPEDLFSAAAGSETANEGADPLAAKMSARQAQSKKGVHIEQADVAESGKSSGARKDKQEPAMNEHIDESLLEYSDLEIEQMEINLDDDDFAPRQQASPQVTSDSPEDMQPGLLDDDEPRFLSADDSAIEATDDVAAGMRADGNEPAWGADDPEFTAQEEDGDWTDEVEEPVSATTEEPEPAKDPDIEVITLFVTGDIQGAILLQMTTELGLKYGDMDIFHRHQESSGHGPVLFSVANMFNPGTFDIHHMERFESEGIVLFMTLPLKSDGHQAFTMMYNAANKIADAMPRAAVLDGNRNPVTKQSVQHTYQRIREFERKQRLQKPTPQWS
ncbi:MAG: cell division protein ZipA [Idiomarina sp.]|nr:cell division protein ZipA [Idiomarina sp.]